LNNNVLQSNWAISGNYSEKSFNKKNKILSLQRYFRSSTNILEALSDKLFRQHIDDRKKEIEELVQ